MFFNHTHRTYMEPSHEYFKYVHSTDGFDMIFNHVYSAMQCELYSDCYHVLQPHVVRITFIFQTSMLKCNYSLKLPFQVELLLHLEFTSNENINDLINLPLDKNS